MAELLVFFDVLSYYLVTESDAANTKDSNIFENFCSGYAPAPLGDDLNRFNRLLREMETSRPEEFSRLFAAAKAPQLKDQEETSATSLYSALNQGAEIRASIRRKERLWQARLILKLAEMLDRKDAEVRQGLARISSVEQNVFAAMDGIQESGSDNLEDVNNLAKTKHLAAAGFPANEPDAGTSRLLIPLRLRAWAELYLADDAVQLPSVIVTDSSESGTILLDGYENTWQQVPEKLFALSLPAIHSDNSEKAWAHYLASRNSFRRAAQENLKYFSQILQAAADSASDDRKLSKLTEILSAWEGKVLEYFPAQNPDLKKLVFYRFPGISCTELFQRLFHLAGPVPDNKKKYPTGLLAVLAS